MSNSLLFIQGRTAPNKYNKVQCYHFSNEVFIYSGKKSVLRASRRLDRDLSKLISFKKDKFFFKQVILPNFNNSLLFIQGRTAANKYKRYNVTISLMKSLFIHGRSLFRELPTGWTEIQAN